MKHAREQLNILTAYEELGSYRAAAALCGTTHDRPPRRRAAPPTDGRAAGPPQERLHHLKVGAAFARRRVLAIVDEREVTVVALATGEILSSDQMITDVADDATHVSPMSRLKTMAGEEGFEPSIS